MNTLDSKTRRLKILNKSEIEEIYERPKFSFEERKEYFSLDRKTEKCLKGIKKFEAKVYFILLMGYFRAKPIITQIEFADIKDDTNYILSTYFPKRSIKQGVGKAMRSNLLSRMLELSTFEKYSHTSHKSALMDRLGDVATISGDPRYIFDECMTWFSQNRVAAPAYTTIQDLITTVLSDERKRTETFLSENMNDLTAHKLSQMIKTKTKLNELKGVKSSAKDFSPTQIAQEIETQQTIKAIYQEIKSIIEKLRLSNGNLEYYSSIIDNHSSYSIRRFPKWQGILYLICYLYFRYQESNDRLKVCFSYLVTQQMRDADIDANSRIASNVNIIQGKLPYTSDVLELITSDDISDDTPFIEVKEKILQIMSIEEIKTISQHLSKEGLDKKLFEWEFIEKKSKTTANSLRKIFLALDFKCESGSEALKRQIATTKAELTNKKKILTIDQRIVGKKDRPYLIQEDEVNPKRFEFFLYKKIHQNFETEKVYLDDCIHSKRLEDDLISLDDWKNKKDLIDKTGLKKLKQPISKTLAELKSKFEYNCKLVTNNINANKNDFVQVNSKMARLDWSTASKKTAEDVDNPIFKELPNINITDIMHYVNRQTNYLSAFNNITTRKHKTSADNNDLIACIFANGSNYGLYKMANSSDRDHQTLRSVEESYLRPETAHAANEIISTAMSQLSVYNHYTINEDAPFGSFDGQKHKCRFNTFKARYSAKYFRKGKGVSAVTLVCNHVPVNSQIIAPNQYEGHFAFDLLYNNNSAIEMKSLATDTHGVNNVNFAVLDIFDYQFSPRYAKFKNVFNDQFEVAFNNNGISLQLKKPFNVKLIESEWAFIQRIICSLSRKTASQSTLIKKLSNSKLHNRALRALHEYDRLIKCIYLLEYTDNTTLRQFVQQALNRGEAYHQLRRAIANINGNEFRVNGDKRISEWNDCARLIANCIIYYNAEIISTIIDKLKENGNESLIEELSKFSPVAWRHIQLTGFYEFNHSEEDLNLAEIIESLARLYSDSEVNNVA